MKNHIFTFLVFYLGFGIFLSESLNPAPKLRIYFILVFFSLYFSQLIKSTFIKNVGQLTQLLILGFIVHLTAYNNHVTDPDQKVSQKIYHFRIEAIYKPSKKYLKYKVKNLKNGNISMAYFSKENDTIYPKDSLVVVGKNYPLTKTLNPAQFDYSTYLRRQNIQSNLYVSHILKHQSSHQNWRKLIVKSKDLLRFKLKSLGYTQEARSIISSMLLGNRTELTDDLNTAYVATGVVHILSISGLHVVMIYVILNFILRPLTYLKNGNRIRIICSLICIWLFAFYVEMQPPVFRSALMISIYYISELLKRPKNIYQTLSLSAFIILLFQPNFLFDVGFQLSFSAVFFIVWLHPIYKIWIQFKSKIGQYLYDLSTTSLSAQLGTMPFAMYYFHQFSGLFLFGNLVLIPASFLMIVGAIIAILLALINFKLPLFTTLYNDYISICNSYIKWLSQFEGLIVRQINLSVVDVLLIFLALILVRNLFLKYSKKALAGIIFCFLLIQIQRFWNIYQVKSSNELIVFHSYKSSIIGLRNGQHLSIFYSDPLDSTQAKTYILEPYQIKNYIQDVQYFQLDSAYQNNRFYKSKSLLITSNQCLYIGKNLTSIPEKIDYILVRNSSFQPSGFANLSQIKRVIADGSNYPNYVSELDSVLKQNGYSNLYQTSEQGYFQIKF